MTPPLKTDASPHDSYDPAFFQTLFEVEDSHFWFRARNQVIAATVKRVVSDLPSGYKLLEVGCGTGNVLRTLPDICFRGTVTGMDLFSEGLTRARQRTTTPLVQGDMHYPPFAHGEFDVIGLFDVLEHLPNDMEVLNDLYSILTDRGTLLITVPAHPVLWSYFDEASHHCRRYRPNELRDKLLEAGFRIEYMTQYMMSIFPLVWIGRYLSSLRQRISMLSNKQSAKQMAIQELQPMPTINQMLSVILGVEGNWLARGGTLPMGTSLLAVVKKDEQPGRQSL